MSWIFVCCVALVLSATWMLIAVLARLSPALYAPQAVRFGGAALFLLIVIFCQARRPPQISLRLFHAAITVAALAYVLSPLMIFAALRTLPSGFCALAYSTIPVWFLLLVYGYGRERLYEPLVIVIGLGLVMIAGYDESGLRGSPLLSLVLLTVGISAFIAGLWVSRRLFWLHSAMDLNFWSMCFAAFVHLFLALATNEPELMVAWSGPYWIGLLILTFVITGAGSIFYRLNRDRVSVTLMSGLVPAGAMGIGFALWRETPVSVLSLAGAVAVIGILCYNGWLTKATKWLCLFINNDRRQLDRLICHLQGTIAKEGDVPGAVQVNDISAGGLGYRSEKSFEKGDIVSVNFPINHPKNCVMISCQIVHASPDSFSKDFPFRGGLQFQKLTEDKWQVLTEFLARLSKAEEE